MFWGHAGAHIVLICALTVLMSYAEAIGIALFFPLFSDELPAQQPWNPVLAILDSLDIRPSPASVLPLIMGLYVLKGLIQYVTFRYQYYLIQLVCRRLRRRALTALSTADYQHVAGTNAGFFSNLLTTEINRAAGGFGHFVKTLSPLLSASVLFVMVLLMDWRLSVVCVVMGMLLLGLTRVVGKIVRKYSAIVTKEMGVLTGLAVQTLHAFKYLRTTALYSRLDKRLEATSENVLVADFKGSNANSFLIAMTQPVMVVFLGGLLYFRAVVQGAEIATLFVLLLYFFRVMVEVFTLQTSWQQFTSLTGSVDLVRELTLELERAAEPNGSQPSPEVRDAIVLDNVQFGYKTGGNVLEHIDLRIEANTTIAFVGGSGAGKTTLVDLITGTLHPTSGRILLDGKDLSAVDLTSLRQRIGYVPQDAVLFDDTVAANIAVWSEEFTHEQIRDAARRAHCLEFIERLPQGFETPVGDRGVKLSGGQRQRLAIARELLRNPDILVLDEATSALDTESELSIQRSIDELKGQMTIIIIAHRLSTIRTSDRVYVLANGTIIEEGGFDELAARPDGHFHRMCELQELAP